MKEHKINAKGKQCPLPIVQVFKTVKKADGGDIIRVEATDKGFPPDIGAWCKKTGNELVETSHDKGIYMAVIRKK